MDRAEGGAGGGFSPPPPPPLFCKNKVNSAKNNLTKRTEPKIAPTPPPPKLKNLLRGSCTSSLLVKNIL